jgi:NitT/TauT family transport system ATP-binding protein
MTMRETPPKSPPAKLVVEGVSKWFRTKQIDVQALESVSLSVADGEFVCLVGPSGCGKSTLLNMIAGLYAPTRGHIVYKGAPVADVNTPTSAT